MEQRSCCALGRILWASSIATLLFTTHFANGIGVCWGRLMTQKLLPATVVDMILANGMEKVKLFSVNYPVLEAFTQSNISVTITVTNLELGLVDSPRRSRKWAKQNLIDFIDDYNVNIRNVLIAHEPFTKVRNRTAFVSDQFGRTAYVQKVVPALKYLQEAVDGYGRGEKIKVTVSHFTDVLKPVTKPSEGDFQDDIKNEMLEILRLIDSSGAPLHVNMYPLYDIRQRGHPLEFAFFEEENKDYYVIDGDRVYGNVFDEMYDTFLWALAKNGYPNIPITVSQVGWPTDGDLYANISTAKRFYDGFLNKMRKKIGTPLHPGPLDAYIYSLADENERNIEYRGPSERYYGIYYNDGRPKFDIAFSDVEGVERKLEPAQGVMYMPRRWCVADPSIPVGPGNGFSNIQFDFACSKADCSSLMYGSSCNGVLDYRGNLSYAFNMYFQRNNQNILDHACDFEGMGKVVNEDPSPKNGSCPFPLQIMSTLWINGRGEMGITLASAGERLTMGRSGFMIVVSCLTVFLLYMYL